MSVFRTLPVFRCLQPWRYGYRMVSGAVFVGALVLGACSSDDGAESTPPEPAPSTTAAPATTTVPEPDPPEGNGEEIDDVPEPVAVEFDVRVSSGQVTVTGAEPGTSLELSNGDNIHQGDADELGNLIFRLVEPGPGYVVSITGQGGTDPFEVPDLDQHPDPSFYDSQTMVEGLNYIEMRDGTLIAAMVRFPDGAGGGPFPTVIEYSGYDPASPYAEEPTIQIYRSLGYATVGVNMRGSGCSGGAYDYFEPLQSIDGYDAIEVIAAQDWVQHNHVGMVGISYSGISQLFVAATQPPSLAAITPISVIEDTYRSVLYPGGIYNNGFAKSWADSRQGANDAYGQEWVTRRVDEGDEICDANQLLRSQNRDLDALTTANEFYDPAVGDLIAPRTFVEHIEVPVFLAGAWQDEQTGGRFATMLNRFTGSPVFGADLYNGAHADSLGPYSLQRAAEFLDVYVARRTPAIAPLIRFGAPILYEQVFGVAGIQVPPDRFSSLEEAQATIESEPPLRLLLDMGSAPGAVGAPVPRNVWEFETLPQHSEAGDGSTNRYKANNDTWLIGSGGALISSTQTGSEPLVEAFTVVTTKSQQLTKTADGDGDANEFDNLNWPALVDGEALVYRSEPFAEDRLLLGSGTVELRVAADAADADLEVTISEIRPDGTEMYIQSGWLRASHRGLGDDIATLHSHSSADFEPLPASTFTDVVVEIFPSGHVFRAGSRLALTIDSPGGNRNLWAFDVVDADGTSVYVEVNGASRLNLPMIETPADLNPALGVCGSQRSQPCRAVVEWVNRAA